MNQNISIRTNILLKKAIATLYVIFALLSLFSYINVKPINSHAVTYDTYYCGMNGGTTGYYSRDVSSVSTSHSWLSYSCRGWGEYTVYVAASTYVSTNNQRTGYVYFRDSKGNLINRITVYQTNPCISIPTSVVTISNVKNGHGTVTVRSNISFEYSVTDDTKGRLYNTKGKMANSNGSMQNYRITVNTKDVNRTGVQWKNTFQVKATKYKNNAIRTSTLIQNTEYIAPKTYEFSGSYVNYKLKFTGEKPCNLPIDQTYNYSVKTFEMPASGLNITNNELKQTTLTNGIQIEMPANSSTGKLYVKINGKWEAYAKVKLNSNTLGLTITPYGYVADFNCDYKEV